MLVGVEEPPADWPTPIDHITPERLAEIEAEVTTLERTVDEIESREGLTRNDPPPEGRGSTTPRSGF